MGARARKLLFFAAFFFAAAARPLPAQAGWFQGFADWLSGSGDALAQGSKQMRQDGGKSWDEGGVGGKVGGGAQIALGTVGEGFGEAMSWLGGALGGGKKPEPGAGAQPQTGTTPTTPPPTTPATHPDPYPTGWQPGAGGAPPGTGQPAAATPPGASYGAPPGGGGGGDGGRGTRPLFGGTPAGGEPGAGPENPSRSGLPGILPPGTYQPPPAATADYTPAYGGSKLTGLAAIPDVVGTKACDFSDERCGRAGKSFALASGPKAGGARGFERMSASARAPQGGRDGGGPSLGELLKKGDMPPGFEQALAKQGAPAAGAAGAGPAAGGAPAGPTGIGATRRDEPDPLDGRSPLLGRGADDMTKGQSADALLDAALAKLEHRDWPAAVQLLTRALELEPDNAALYAHRATAYNMKGDYAAAERDAREAVRLNPESAKGWENLAWAQLRQGKYEEALASAGRAAALDPRSGFALAIRAYAKERLGDRQGSLNDIAKASFVDPRFRGQYEAAKGGRPIFDPARDYSEFFLPSKRKRSAPGGRPPWLLFAGLGALVIGGAGFAWSLRRRGSGSPGVGGRFTHLVAKAK